MFNWLCILQFFGYKEEDKGYYAGLVASAVFAGRAFGRYVRFVCLSISMSQKPYLGHTLLRMYNIHMILVMNFKWCHVVTLTLTFNLDHFHWDIDGCLSTCGKIDWHKTFPMITWCEVRLIPCQRSTILRVCLLLLTAISGAGWQWLSDKYGRRPVVLVTISLSLLVSLYSYFWGWLSDKYGRRPVVLITVIANGLFSLIFGFTINLPMAIITRFLTGLVNGTYTIVL